jgi:propanol-preferring alcohol dehydrogenase
VAGKIVEVGKGVDKSHISRNVIVYTYLFCGKCEFCLSGRENLCSYLRGSIGLSEDGGYAEYLKAPFENLFFIEDLPFEKAAIIPDAIATSYHALASKVKIKPGQTVAVIGAGGVGIHAIQIARAFGARVIAVDLNARALTIAQEMGAEKGVQATNNNNDDMVQETMDFSRGKGVDVVVECSGDPRMEMLALNILKVTGVFVAVGYSPENPFRVDSHLLVSKELEIIGSRSKNRTDIKETIDLVLNSKVKPFVGEVHPLVEANSVLNKLERGDIVGRSVLVP